MDCNLCSLRRTCTGPIWGEGDPCSPYWLIGEAPGEKEDLLKRPFVGKSGEEMDGTYLLRNGLSRDLFYITNLVKCRPPQNRDPKPEEIAACQVAHLQREMQQCHPEAVIGTLGRFATSKLLSREVDMSMYHGIPLRMPGRVIVPIYHPALGLHSTSMMTQIMADFRALAAVIRGNLAPEDYQDPIPNPIYRELKELYSPFKPKVLAVDTESVRNTVWSIQISWQFGEAWFIRATDAAAINWLKEAVADPKVLVVLHHAQHDLPMLAQVGIRPARWTDTMLMANLLQDVPKGLKALAFRLCFMPMRDYADLVDPITEARTVEYLSRVVGFKWPTVPEKVRKLVAGEYKWTQPQPAHTAAKTALTAFAKGNCRGKKLYDRWHNAPASKTEALTQTFGTLRAATIADVDQETALYYACRDPDATLRVYYQLYPRIAMEKLEGPLDRDCRAVPMTVDMVQHGIWANQEYLTLLGDEYDRRKDGVVEDISKLIGRRINPASTDQVAHLLFKELGLKAKWKTDGGKDSTGSEVLETLIGAHPVVPLIILYRELDKSKGTFVDGVLDNCRRWPDGRCRTDLSMIRTATGRFAASAPNLLAYPQEDRSGEGATLRNAFEAGPGRVFLSGDWSQIELRTLADQSQEPAMLRIFREGKIDIHTGMGAEVFRVPIEQVTSKQRYAVKKVNFGIPYGITAAGLFKFLEPEGWDKKGCERLIDEWFSRFPKVADYMNRIKAFARRYRYVEDFCGRRRLIPEVLSVHQFVREAGLRQAGNMPIQTGANSILKEAMAQLTPIYKQLQQEGYYIWPLLPIHDDLLWEVDENILPWLVPIIKVVMENCITLSVPLVVDFKVGKKWGSMEKYKI